MVAEFGDPLLACQHVVEEAKARWQERDLDHRRDDITIVIAKFEWNKCRGNSEGEGDGGATSAAETADVAEEGEAAGETANDDTTEEGKVGEGGDKEGAGPKPLEEGDEGGEEAAKDGSTEEKAEPTEGVEGQVAAAGDGDGGGDDSGGGGDGAAAAGKVEEAVEAVVEKAEE